MAEYVWKRADTVVGGDKLETGWKDAQLATHVWSSSTSNSGHARTFETSKSMETETKLAAPGTNNQRATALAAAHPSTSHPFFDCPLMHAAISLVDTMTILLSGARARN